MKNMVSIIMPAYKVEPFLRQCLDSVISQSYHNLQIICIDDGSPDNCGAIFDEYSKMDDRFVVIHKENEGLSAGWNQGLYIAQGKWISFVDTDDWIETNYIEKLVNAAEENDADITIGSECYICSGDTRIEKQAFSEPFVLSGKEKKQKMRERLFMNEKTSYSLSYVWNKLYKRSFITQNQLAFDNNIPAGYPNDTLFNFMAFGQARTICGAINCGYNYRLISTSGTRKFNPSFLSYYHYYLDKLYQYVEEHNESTEDMQRLLDWVSFVCISRSFRYFFFHPNNTSKQSIAKNLAEMKKMPRFKHAIWQEKNPYFSRNQVLLKYVLRTPFVVPLRLLYKANEKKNRN